MKDKKGFTLIELLVVIAIIALLMSILMPALSKVRELAKSIKCKANLRGIGVAAVLYANDWETYIPRGGTTTQKCMLEYFMPYMGYNKKMDDVSSTDKLTDVKAFRCPSYPDKKAILTYVTNGWALPHTGANATVNFAAAEQRTPTKLSKFVRLADTIYMADDEDPTLNTGRAAVKMIGQDPDANNKVTYYFRDVWMPTHLPVDGWVQPPSGGAAISRRVAAERHNKGSNVLYADSHVDHVETEDMLKPAISGYRNDKGNAAGIDMWRFWK